MPLICALIFSYTIFFYEIIETDVWSSQVQKTSVPVYF